MRKFSLSLLVLGAAALVIWVYQQVFVEKSFGPSAMLLAGLAGSALVLLSTTWALHGTRYRAAMANVWLILVSVAASYVVLDLVAGWLLIQPLSPPLSPDEYVHHKLVPNSRSEFRRQDFSYVQRVNNLGLRGRDIAAQKPAANYRIVMLGDSFTMGLGVEDDQTFSAVLERSLNRRVAACRGRTIEVLNAGVDSYAPVLSYLQLKREISPLSPDMVVLNLDVSDLAQEAAYRRIAVYGADGDVTAVPIRLEKETLTERLRRWSERRLYLTRLVLFYTNRLFGYKDLSVREVVTQANAEIVAHTLAGDVDRTDQWRLLFDSLRRMRDYCDAHRIEFVLTVYPWAHQISNTEWIPGRYLFMPKDAKTTDTSLETVRALAAANGIQFLDLFPVFRANLGAKPLYFSHDMHWTPAGHEVVARGLADYLAPRHLKAWCESVPD